MLSCNPSSEEPDFAEVLTALLTPPLTDEGARQLVTDYATLAPTLVDADHDCAFAYGAQTAALHLRQSFTSAKELAAQLQISDSLLSHIKHGRREPDREIADKVRGLSFHQGMGLRNCTLTLFAHACAPWTCWQDAPLDWLTDISGANGTLPLIRAVRDDRALSVWRGMMDSESQYRANHLGANHLLRVIEEARLGVRNAKALPGIGVNCPC